MLKIISFLVAIKNDILDKIESILGVSFGSYIFYRLNIPLKHIASSPDGIGMLVTRELIHLAFAIIASAIITTITHIIKVEITEWYKNFKNKP